MIDRLIPMQNDKDKQEVLIVKEHYLVMKWGYKYDKESTWFDENSGITELEFETEPPRGVVLRYGAFKHCDKHMTKEMKEKIKSIGSGAFK